MPLREAAAVARAAKAGFITVLVSAATSGTVYDLGLMFYILAGSVSALTVPSLVRVSNAPAARMQQIGVVGRLQ